MPLRLDAGDSGFEAAFGRFLDGKREIAEDVDAAVAGIVAAVSRRGDAALVEFTERFDRSEEHTSELQSLMRNSYAVFCLKNKKNTTKKKYLVMNYTLKKTK